MMYFCGNIYYIPKPIIRLMKSYQERVIVTILCYVLIIPVLFLSTLGATQLSRETTKSSVNWSDDIRLTYFTEHEYCDFASRFDMAVSNNMVYIICEEYWEIEPPWSKTELRYIKSNNCGVSWTLPINFTTTDNCYSMFPNIATENSNVYVVWQDYRGAAWEIYFKNSSDSGNTWQNDTALTENDGKASQWPYIGASENELHVIWGDCRDDAPYYTLPELYYKRSIDGGSTWDDGLGNVSQDRRLTFNISESVTTSPHGIAVEGSTIHVIATRCLSTNERVVGYLKSDDNGADWSDTKILSTEGDGYHSYGWDIAVNQSNVHVVWIEQKHGGINEIYYRNSTDSGDSWNPEVRLTNTTTDEYDPHITVNGSWTWVSWWSTSDNCGYYRLSKDNGTTWEDPVQLTTQSGTPILAVSDGYVHAVFTSDRTGNSEIYYKRSPPFGSEPANITITANPNVLTADGVSNSTLTIWVYNNTGVPMPNQTVSLSVSGSGTVSNVIDNGDGSYIADYTTGTVAGNVIITATAGFVSNNTTIILKAGAVAKIEINPPGPTIYNKTETRYYTAIGYDIYQNINTTWQPVWKVDGNVGTINETGFFTATKEGSGAVNCSDANTGVYNISLVTVLNRRPNINSVSPSTNITITEFQNQTFWVNASDDDGDNLIYQWYLNENLLVNETNSSYIFIMSGNFSGNYFVKVSVFDGEYFANHTWIVTVINVGDLQQTINELQNQLNQSIANYTALQAIISQLNDNLSSVWNQLNESLGNNTELKNIIGSLSQNLMIIWNELNQSLSNNTSLQSVINQLNNTLNISTTQISALWTQLNQSSLNETSLQSQISSLNENITNLQKQIAQLEREKEQAESEREQSTRESWVIIGILLAVVVAAWVSVGLVRRKKE